MRGVLLGLLGEMALYSCPLFWSQSTDVKTEIQHFSSSNSISFVSYHDLMPSDSFPIHRMTELRSEHQMEKKDAPLQLNLHFFSSASHYPSVVSQQKTLI